ncbi:type II toxin-antitoxin system RelE/ParE family toxin [Marinoscillum furvescens]|uniref:ParE-like toxin of type II ParDE toxin-antitoxin system n=1 Tax=Marinoscillum furvescens DSM 4134 TaxID=1122208 RepID=A0A3D9L2C4_MARFU|nr:type II toxin-antitoxin system RelE/ParE family toxin [Marinoscillum furvescens]RED98891.1 hypothetical protein C7460_10983 [Marinoscillum furvescens DSM 4134]
MEIIWSEEAKSDFESNIQYLLEKWSETSASNFIDEDESIINLNKKGTLIYFQKVDFAHCVVQNA